MREARFVRSGRFALTGHAPGHKYNWKVLKSYIAEIRSAGAAVAESSQAVRNLLFWKGHTALLSLGTCIGVQKLILHPQWIPATGPLVCLFWLHHNLAKRTVTQPQPRARTRIGSFTAKAGGFFGIVVSNAGDIAGKAVSGSLAVVGKTTELVARGPGGAKKATQGMLGLDNESDSEDERITAGEKGSYAYKVAEMREELEDALEDELEEIHHVNEGFGETLLTINTINPLAPILGPVQRALGKVVVQLRTIQRILAWEDPFLTMHLYIILVLLMILLMIIPWAPVLHYGARAIGFLVFGPHMHIVGRKLDAKAAEEHAKETEYQDGDERTRARMIEEARAELKAEMEQRLKEEMKHLAKRTKSQKAADDFIEANENNLSIRPTRTSGRFRYRSTPILKWSTATPMVDANTESAVQVAEQVPPHAAAEQVPPEAATVQ